MTDRHFNEGGAALETKPRPQVFVTVYKPRGLLGNQGMEKGIHFAVWVTKKPVGHKDAVGNLVSAVVSRT